MYLNQTWNARPLSTTFSVTLCITRRKMWIREDFGGYGVDTWLSSCLLPPLQVSKRIPMQRQNGQRSDQRRCVYRDWKQSHVIMVHAILVVHALYEGASISGKERSIQRKGGYYDDVPHHLVDWSCVDQCGYCQCRASSASSSFPSWQAHDSASSCHLWEGRRVRGGLNP